MQARRWPAVQHFAVCFNSVPTSFVLQSVGCRRVLDEELLGRLPQKPTDGEIVEGGRETEEEGER